MCTRENKGQQKRRRKPSLTVVRSIFIDFCGFALNVRSLNKGCFQMTLENILSSVLIP